MEEPGTKVGVENARRAARAALIAATLRGFDVIAIPGLGTGLGGLDPSEAARAMVDELPRPPTTQANHCLPGGHQRRNPGLSGRGVANPPPASCSISTNLSRRRPL